MRLIFIVLILNLFILKVRKKEVGDTRMINDNSSQLICQDIILKMTLIHLNPGYCQSI